jgi:GH15 family glucan-1,4-alpha-glucosidase
VYGEMIAAIAPLYLDVRFEDHARSLPLVSRLLGRIEATLESPDAGLWEIRAEPKVHSFSVLMHWVGAEVAARIADAANDDALGTRARRLSVRARALLEQRTFLADRGFYADAVDGKNADAALLMMINLGFLPKGHPHAEGHLRGLAKELFVRPPLLHRYRHFDGIGETHSAFTVCGFWYVEALARLGHVEEAERGFETMLQHANHVGLFSEDLDPATGEQWGNFPQTYSHVGLINAAFAISPLPNEVGDP